MRANCLQDSTHARSYRTVQYFSRFLAFYTYRKGYTKDTIARFSNLKSALGSARKRAPLYALGTG